MTHAYILIRTKLDLECIIWRRKKYKYFRECLESALRQTYPNTSVIIHQDDNLSLRCTPKKYSSQPRVVENIIRHYKGSLEHPAPQVLTYVCNSHGAAQSLYNIREVVCQIAHNDDIAILLDDDDMLTSTTIVEEIVAKMDNDKRADICISQFETIGEPTLNIVNQAGYIHNDLIERLDKQNTNDIIRCDTEIYGKGALCFADSLGWTKAYRIKVIKAYHQDLLSLFKTERELKRFLRKNNAFEDFPEVINLCRKDFNTTVLATKTHKYRKHPNSITATPRKQDFRCKRTAYLTLLMELYLKLTHENKFNEAEGCSIIARYFTIKILTIENLLAKFRTRNKHKKWLHKTYNGSFVEWLISSLRKRELLYDFKQLLKTSLLSHLTKPTVDDMCEDIIKCACAEEAKRGIVDICHCFGDNSTHFQTERINNIKRRLCSNQLFIGFVVIATIVICISILKEYEKAEAVLSCVITVAIGLCGWAGTNILRIKTESVQDDKITEMFSNAIDDLVRHIVAGYMVLHKIQQEIDRDSAAKPAKVHFSNLKVSQQSLLMSDEFDNNLVVQEFKNLPRLRVNIRNINNSAEYMENYLDNPAYNAKDMYDIIDWEMNRYVGYFVNIMFFKENNVFRFPKPEERDIFLKTHRLYKDFIDKACGEGCDYKHLILKLKLEDRYRAYCNDRGENRKVLIF